MTLTMTMMSTKWGFHVKTVLLLSFLLLLLTISCTMSSSLTTASTSTVSARSIPSSTSHKSNHAVILSSSRYWFNYRHVVNALSIYSILRENGYSDDNIVLMLADEIPANPRNPRKNAMYAHGTDRESLFPEDIEIDYRGDDVTVDNIRNVLLGKSTSSSSVGGPGRKRRTLQADRDSNVFVYWTGHGGDEFFKFQDVEEITAGDIAELVDEMRRMDLYKNLLFLADTCQAFTLANHIAAENVYAIGSSLQGENSYAHHSDYELGLSVIERYTYKLGQNLGSGSLPRASIHETMVDQFRYKDQRAHVGIRQTGREATRDGKTAKQIWTSDFFAAKGHGKTSRGISPSIVSSDSRLPDTDILRRLAIKKEVSSDSCSATNHEDSRQKWKGQTHSQESSPWLMTLWISAALVCFTLTVQVRSSTRDLTTTTKTT